MQNVWRCVARSPIENELEFFRVAKMYFCGQYFVVNINYFPFSLICFNFLNYLLSINNANRKKYYLLFDIYLWTDQIGALATKWAIMVLLRWTIWLPMIIGHKKMHEFVLPDALCVPTTYLCEHESNEHWCAYTFFAVS